MSNNKVIWPTLEHASAVNLTLGVTESSTVFCPALMDEKLSIRPISRSSGHTAYQSFKHMLLALVSFLYQLTQRTNEELRGGFGAYHRGTRYSPDYRFQVSAIPDLGDIGST